MSIWPRYLAPLLGVALACESPQQSPTATIPRHRGPLTPADGRYIDDMNYDPSDAPFAWPHNDTLLIGHAEVYSSADVFSHTCAGSGFFKVSIMTGAIRTLAAGAPACDAVVSYNGAAADPDGRWIVYSTNFPSNTSGLLRIDLSSKAVDSLPTGCRIYHDQPAVSRDGAFIAGRGLCRDRNQPYYRIYISTADGHGLRALPTRESASDEMPAWSPDGKRIAFEVSRGKVEDRVDEIAVQDVNGNDRRRLTRGLSPAWSPDGQWIAFLSIEPVSGERPTLRVIRSFLTLGPPAGYSQTLRVIRPDGTGERVVFKSVERGTYARGWGPNPEGLPSGPLVWSPDSRWIAFTRRYDAGSSVWRVEISSGRIAQVTAPDHRQSPQ